LTAPAFARRARQSGAEIHTGVEVLGFEKRRDRFALKTTRGPYECKKVVVTSNAGIRQLLGKLGIEVHISNSPVQVSVSEQIEQYIKYLFYFTTEKLTLKQAKSGSVLIGGGWPARTHPDGRISVHPDSLRSNLRVALQVIPSLSSVKIIRTWTGMGNQTPDHRPIIDSLPGHMGAYVGVFPSLGFSAGPLLGKTLADLVINGETSRDLSQFRIDRFDSHSAKFGKHS
jgi:glycine/D-amino acid oxidase-like deaminating enzyme